MENFENYDTIGVLIKREALKTRRILSGLIFVMSGLVSLGLLLNTFGYFAVITKVSFLSNLPNWEDAVVQTMLFIILSTLSIITGIVLIIFGSFKKGKKSL